MENKKVLVIDDNQDTLDIVEKHLGDEGFKVVVADNGYSGIHEARKGGIDLVLLDIMMPGLDGFGVIKALKDFKETRDIPITMISAKKQREDIAKALSLGAIDYIVKPIDLETLSKKVGRLLNIDLTKMKLSEQIKERMDTPAFKKLSASIRPTISGLYFSSNKKGDVQVIGITGNCENIDPRKVEHDLQGMTTGFKKVIFDISGITDLDIVSLTDLRFFFTGISESGKNVKVVITDKEKLKIFKRNRALRKFPVYNNQFEAMKWF